MNLRAQAEQLPIAAQQVHRFVRLGSWWLPKVGPALAVGYCAAIVFRVPGWATVTAIATVAVVGLCAGTYGYLLNDISDLAVDERAGKSNRMAAFTPGLRFCWCALALGLGFMPALFQQTSRRTLLILVFEYAVLTVYSVQPFRLKTRGAWGLLCDASGAHVVASLYVLSVVADARKPAIDGARIGSVALFAGLICAWELCLGLIGILSHQFKDRENDLRSGIRTFATERSFLELRTPTTLIYVGELLAFTGLCFVLRRVAPLVGMTAALYVLLLGIKVCDRWPHYRNFKAESTLTEWWLSSHIYYEAYFPFAAALQCALLHPQVLICAALHLPVFVQALRAQILDVFSVFPGWAMANPHE